MDESCVHEEAIENEKLTLTSIAIYQELTNFVNDVFAMVFSKVCAKTAIYGKKYG